MALQDVMRVDNGKVIRGGGTSDYADLTNKPSINGVTLSGNKTTSDLGIDKTAVGLGNVPNVSTNDQTPTFSQASTRNNIASGEKLSVIFGKIQKFFNDLKTVAFSGSFSDLSNKPSINSVELSGNKTASQLGMANSNTFQGTIAEWNQLSTAEKKAYDHASIPDSIDGGVTFPANKVVMTGGGNVEDAVDNVFTATNATGVSGAFHYTKIGRIVVGAGLMTMTQNLSEYSDIVTELPRPETITMGAFEANESGYNRVFVNDRNGMGTITTRTARNSGDSIRLSCVYLSAH